MSFLSFLSLLRSVPRRAVSYFFALSREGRPSSPHTTLAGAICALYSEFFTSEPLKSGLFRPQAALSIVGAQKSLQFRRRQALGSQDSSSEFLGVFGAARSALEQLRLALSSSDFLGATRSSSEQLGSLRSSSEFLGAPHSE